MASILGGCRILGYVATIFLHVAVMLSVGQLKSDDPRIQAFRGMRPRYLTGWNVALQIVHAALGLCCEYLLIKNWGDKSYSLPRYLRGARDKLFTNVVFPGSFVVAIVFWTLFTYDRELVFPGYLDQIIPLSTNHVIHTAIVPVVLFEILVQPRYEPRSHVWNCCHILLHSLLYGGVILYTYYEKGIWLYPILGILSPPMFAAFAATMIGVAYFFYFLQWRLLRLVWGERPKPGKVGKAKKIR